MTPKRKYPHAEALKEISVLKKKIKLVRAILVSTQKRAEEGDQTSSHIIAVQDAGISVALTELQ